MLLEHPCSVLITIILKSVLFLTSSASFNGGALECPCLDQASRNGFRGPTYLPTGYGIGCGAHGPAEDPPTCREGDKSSSCTTEWCYVNPFNCKLLFFDSDVFRDTGYSYSTCGFHDHIKNAFHGNTLRAHFVTNTGGWKGTFCVNGGPGKLGTNCDGPLPAFVRDIAKSANFTLEEKSSFDAPVHEQASRLNVTSDFDKCVIATGMGFADLCVTLIVKTAERSSWSDSIPIGAVSGHLYTIRSAQQLTLYDNLLIVFKPFEPDLWFSLLGAVVLFSALMVFHERDADEEFSWKRHPLQTTFNAMYKGLRGFLNQSGEHPDNTPEGKLAMLGYGSLIVLTIATYTSNFAIMLYTQPPRTPRIEDAIDRNLTICVSPAFSAALQSQFDNIGPLLLPVTQRQDIPAMIESSTCQAAIHSRESYDKWVEDGASSSCKLVRDKSSFADLSFNTLFVSARVKGALSYWVADGIVSGQWESAKSRFKVKSKCARTSEKEDHSLPPESLLGAFCLAGAFALLGLMVKCVRVLLAPASRQGRLIKIDKRENESCKQNIGVRTRLEALLVRVESQQEEMLRHLTSEFGSRVETVPLQGHAPPSKEGTMSRPAMYTIESEFEDRVGTLSPQAPSQEGYVSRPALFPTATRFGGRVETMLPQGHSDPFQEGAVNRPAMYQCACVT